MKARARLATLAALALLAGACGPSGGSGTPAAPSVPTPSRTASPTVQPSPAHLPSPTPDPTPRSAIVPGTVDRSSLVLNAKYGVDLRLVVGTGALEVAVVIDIRNDSGEDIDRLELNTVAARLGGIDIVEASVDDRPVVVTVDDQTLLVPLGGVLPSGGTATARLAYRATLRDDLDGSNWLFSRAGGTLALYRWIPWVSRAIPFDRPNHGDPFLTPTSPLVRVRITTDVPMVVASPGLDPVADGLTWSFEARDVRDVAVVLAPDLKVEEVAALTPGFTGADLANLVNEAALVATRRGADQVSAGDFTAAIERIVAGLEKKNRLLNPMERRVVAHHEMGHAIVAAAQPGCDPVHAARRIHHGRPAAKYAAFRARQAAQPLSRYTRTAIWVHNGIWLPARSQLTLAPCAQPQGNRGLAHAGMGRAQQN